MINKFDKIKLGNNLLFLRKKNLEFNTQSKLAAFLGTSSHQYQNYEYGKSSIKLEALYKLSVIFQIKIDDLIAKDISTDGYEKGLFAIGDYKFPENIRALREDRKISQLQLVNETNISRATIVNIEKRKTIPSIESAIKMSNYFGVSLDALCKSSLFRKSNNKGNNVEETIINDILKIINSDSENRYFRVLGDSMEPNFFHNDILVTEQTEQAKIENHNVYVIESDTFSFGRIINMGIEVQLMQDKKESEPIVLSADSIKFIYKVVMLLTSQIPAKQDLTGRVDALEKALSDFMK